jgi:16S rRNA (cytidine1402-2'-O)-methyltransferase
VPGASAFTAALAASGQPPLPALLVGFLPARAGPRRRRIAALADQACTIVVLVSPHRMRAELDDLAAALGRDRSATLLAELSKVHERAEVATLGELCECDEVAQPRGEYALVIGPGSAGPAPEVSSEEVQEAYRQELHSGKDRRQAMRAAGQRLGLSRRQVYAALMEPDEADE